MHVVKSVMLTQDVTETKINSDIFIHIKTKRKIFTGIQRLITKKMIKSINK